MNHDLLDELTSTLNWIDNVNEGDDDVVFDLRAFAVNNEATVRACRCVGQSRNLS